MENTIGTAFVNDGYNGDKAFVSLSLKNGHVWATHKCGSFRLGIEAKTAQGAIDATVAHPAYKFLSVGHCRVCGASGSLIDMVCGDCRKD